MVGGTLAIRAVQRVRFRPARTAAGFLKGCAAGKRGSTAAHRTHLRRAAFKICRHVWSKRGDSQERWSVIGASLGVIETCDDLDRQLSDHLRNQETLLDFYINSL